jgi:ABC-type branched-subunit amino acid transport system ATPase component
VIDAMSSIIDRAHRNRDAGRRILLGDGGAQPLTRSRQAVKAGSQAGWYMLIALSIYTALDQATAYIVSAIGPDISASLGMSPSAYTMLASQRQTFVGLTALQFAQIFYKRQQRARLANNFGFQYGPSLFIGSLITWAPGMTFVIGASGAGAAVVYAAHRPMLMDHYPPGRRLRVLSIHGAASVAGAICAAVLVTVLSGVLGLSWRGTLLIIGILFVPLSFIGLRLRDPGCGRFDSDEIAGLMHDDADPCRTGDPCELSFWEAVQRVWLIPSVRRMLAVWAVLGVAVNPLITYQGFWLQEQFGLGTDQRAYFFAGSWVLALPALWFTARKGERMWRQDPARLGRVTAWLLAAMASGLLLAIVPVLAVSMAGFAIVFATESVAVVTLSLILMTIVRPRHRSIVAALTALFFGLVGGEGGAILLSGVASRYSPAVAIGVLAAPALGAAILLARCTRHLDQDVDSVVHEVLEDEGVHAVVSRSARELPLLACRGIDFSYGQLKVLHGVDFTVRDGELVALLGVNGAGKSSLLKVVSGIGLPGAGSVRLDGRDITYLDAERRVRMGITQIPGGHGVFGPMTVADNLRGMAYALGRNRNRVNTAIDECFDAFPVLAERRNKLAWTLSGGEQQMLALSKAFLLKPRLLLIDELSLGLAPIVVDRLLGMVRRINDAGTAVVLVEQSVSIALNVVSHAYFMEKGEIRFDGAAADLLVRDDLLRAVFLGAAARDGNHA